jgi:transposase-like protein
VRALYSCICGSFGMLLFGGTTLAPADISTGSVGTNSVEMSSIDKSASDGIDDCMLAQSCIDRYLWSLYERTRKIDAIRVPERTTVRVNQKGKTKIVEKTITKLVEEDFAWKDQNAAERAGMSPMDYVIGGMDPSFRDTLYHALRALEEAGLMPGIVSGFRDDYRQTIAMGLKAQSDKSYHGGSFRGGYGHGLAADIVSVNGETRVERLASSKQLWKWIDTHEKELQIGRPYLDRDPPHVAPIDGEEYAAHRLKANTQHAEAKAMKQRPPALRNDHRTSRRATVARRSSVYSRSQTGQFDRTPSRARTSRHLVHYRSRS